MKITRLYTGKDGESHFEDKEVPLGRTVHGGSQSELFKGPGMVFRETGTAYATEWRNAPMKQFVVELEGVLEIEVGDGSRRQFGPGDVLLAEDTAGRGHIARSIDGKPRKAIVIPLT